MAGAALAAGLVGVMGLMGGGCYSAGSGSGPPNNSLYYPVGMAVAASGAQAGSVLYVANSDFDLQYNGGTLQSYDLEQVRQDAAALIFQFLNPSSKAPNPMTVAATAIPFVFGVPAWTSCTDSSTVDPTMWSNGQRIPLGEACAPPVDSTQPQYFKHSAVIGAFATDLQLSRDGSRLFAPVRGDATVTWANLHDANTKDQADFDCGQLQNGGRCGGTYVVGNVVDPADSRAVTMPGEPFGLAQTQDGTALAVTQQATQETSLLLSGVPPEVIAGVKPPGTSAVENPSMQFVLEGVPTGGNGIVAIPHDPEAVTRCEDDDDTFPCVRQAFLETSNSAGEIDLLRYYDDDGSSLQRPFLEREAPIGIFVNLPGTDQRGIVVDDTPRLVCKAQEAFAAQKQGRPINPVTIQTCAQKPARVFIGSRSPASVIYGTLGGPSQSNDGTYDPDLLTLVASVPLDPDTGVSRLYLAPIVDKSGHYALRLFVVCYDASTLFVFDPEQIAALEANAPGTIIATGAGPFAMSFDPTCTGLVDSSGNPSTTFLQCPGASTTRDDGALADVATSEAAELGGDLTHYLVPPDAKLPLPVQTTPARPARQPGSAFGLRNYRFGYLATFTNSYVQVIDLDESTVPLPSPAPGLPHTQETFESIVFTLGNPTPPKGS